MAYDDEKTKLGRITVVAGEIDLDVCANTYGVAPCTASGSAGDECYNTFHTCQDVPNYVASTKTYRFWEQRSDLPKIAGFPCIIKTPDFTPTKITPDKGLGWRGSVSINLKDFPHHDRGVDPYWETRTYDAESQGTFFGKLKARNPYYKKRIMRVRSGYLTSPFDWANFEDRTYVIEKIDGPDNAGNVTITGKDILALADDQTAQIPAPSSGSLSAAYTAGVSTTLVLQAGEGGDYDTDPYTEQTVSVTYPAYVRIGDNVLKYTGVSTDTLTGVVGGQFGSIDSDLASGDTAQLCVHFDAANVVAINDFILKKYAGMPEEYIPYDAGLTVPTGTDDEWDIEESEWLSGNNLTYIITKPTGVNDILARINEQNLVYLWWHEIDKEVKLKAIAPVLKNEIPPVLTDASHLLADSVTVKDDPKDRITQLWVYYNKNDVTEDDKPEHYANLHIVIDTDSENENAADEKSVRVIYADWVQSQALIITLAGRLLNRYKATPRTIEFELDARDTSIWTGSSALLDTRMFQGVTGANEQQKVQVMSAKETKSGHKFKYIAQSTVYVIYRYGFIMPDTANDYGSATDAEKQSGCYISAGAGFSDGGDDYRIA